MPYRVTGSVLEDGSGRPLAGLLVRAFDKDLVFDDPLGDATTDAAGRFEVVFTEVQFRDHIETSPDLYVKVFDASGARLLHSTRRDVRRNVRGDENFEIRLAGAS